MLAASLLLAAAVAAGPIPLDDARNAFAEAHLASDEDNGKLWGKPLYEPMIFVDPRTRFAVANQADSNHILKAQDGVFTGPRRSRMRHLCEPRDAVEEGVADGSVDGLAGDEEDQERRDHRGGRNVHNIEVGDGDVRRTGSATGAHEGRAPLQNAGRIAGATQNRRGRKPSHFGNLRPYNGALLLHQNEPATARRA